MWSFRKIHEMGGEIQWRKSFVLQVGMEFQRDSWNGRRDTVEKVLCSSSKVPFVID
jgi:hypothetical protein